MKKIVNIVLLVVWMSIIFFYSNQKGEDSSSLSASVIKTTVKTYYSVIGKELTEEKLNDSVESLSLVVRKTAHFLEYLILGLLMINVLKDFKVFNIKLMIMSLILCCLYASSDEIHQIFIAGRSGQVTDVILDTFGSLVGIVIYGFRKRKNVLS